MPARPDVPLSPIDPTAAEFVDDMVGNYSEIRRAGPLTYVMATRSVLVTGYAEANALLRDPAWRAIPSYELWEKISAAMGRDYGPAIHLMRHMPFMLEGPRHQVMRNALAKAANAIPDDHPGIAGCIAARLGAMRRQGGDLVGDFAGHLLFDIMCELMQIPEADRAIVRPIATLSKEFELSSSLKSRDLAAETAGRAIGYLHAHAPKAIGPDQSRFLTVLFNALPDDGSDRYLTAATLATVLLIMGNEGVGACITRAVQRLLDPEHPGPPQAQWAALSDDAIRFTSPVDSLLRVASRDTVLAGCPVAAGTNAIISAMAANHDPAQFGEHHADIGADDDLGLAFGTGRHFCVGQRLTRAIVKTAFEALAQLPPLRISGPAVHSSGRLLRVLTSLPVEIG